MNEGDGSKGDGEVVASIVAGDPSGLAAAYDRYAAALYAYCCTLLREPADAAGAVQDTFVIASSRLAGLRDPGRLRPWLFAVARNECLRRLRYRSATAPLEELADGPGLADETADVSGEAGRAGPRALLRAAIGGLDAAEREVIGLRLAQGLDAGEVAAILGVSRNHARVLLSRARAQLEASLGVILVGRAGRGECAALDGMLGGWDGRLTAALRGQVHRHVGRCRVCAARRGRMLRPGVLGVAGPVLLAALAGGRNVGMAGEVASAVRDQALAAATGRDPAGLTWWAAITGKAAPFGPRGFPWPLSPPPRGPLGLRWLLGGPRAQLASAAGATAAVVTVAVFLAVSGGPGTGLFKGGGPGGGLLPSAAGSPASTAGPAGGRPGRPTGTATPGPSGGGPGSHASQGRAGSPPPGQGEASASGPAAGPSLGQSTAGQPPSGQSSSPPTATSPAVTPTITVSPTTTCSPNQHGASKKKRC
jgi:RNA polymerase sigma factor (sigma-70 family)